MKFNCVVVITKFTESEKLSKGSYHAHYRHHRHPRLFRVTITVFVLAPSHDVSYLILDVLEIRRLGPQANRSDERAVLDGRPENQNRQVGVAARRMRVIGMDLVARDLPIDSSPFAKLMQAKPPQGHLQHVGMYGFVATQVQL